MSWVAHKLTSSRRIVIFFSWSESKIFQLLFHFPGSLTISGVELFRANATVLNGRVIIVQQQAELTCPVSTVHASLANVTTFPNEIYRLLTCQLHTIQIVGSAENLRIVSNWFSSVLHTINWVIWSKLRVEVDWKQKTFDPMNDDCMNSKKKFAHCQRNGMCGEWWKFDAMGNSSVRFESSLKAKRRKLFVFHQDFIFYNYDKF